MNTRNFRKFLLDNGFEEKESFVESWHETLKKPDAKVFSLGGDGDFSVIFNYDLYSFGKGGEDGQGGYTIVNEGTMVHPKSAHSNWEAYCTNLETLLVFLSRLFGKDGRTDLHGFVPMPESEYEKLLVA